MGIIFKLIEHFLNNGLITERLDFSKSIPHVVENMLKSMKFGKNLDLEIALYLSITSENRGKGSRFELKKYGGGPKFWETC